MKTICFLSSWRLEEYHSGVDRVCSILAREFIRRGLSLVFVYGQSINKAKTNDIKGCERQAYYQLPYENSWDKRNVPFFAEVMRKNDVDVVIDVSISSGFHEIAYAAKKECGYVLISTCHGDPYASLKELIDKYDFISFMSPK